MRIALQRLGMPLAVVLALAGCAVGRPEGYAEGVEFVEQVLEMGDPQMLEEGNDNDLFRQGACEFGAGGLAAELQKGFIEGCMDALRDAA